jgi:hypothetical protein
MLYAGAWVAAVVAAPDGVAAGLVCLGGLVFLSVLAIAVAVALEIGSRGVPAELRRGRTPGASGQALRRLPPANPGGRSRWSILVTGLPARQC